MWHSYLKYYCHLTRNKCNGCAVLFTEVAVQVKLAIPVILTVG
ncbi:MAG: hypothetical protein ACI9QN_001186, partial [Arcticibacterium sp.]